jgi:hypothetical protein
MCSAVACKMLENSSCEGGTIRVAPRVFGRIITKYESQGIQLRAANRAGGPDFRGAILISLERVQFARVGHALHAAIDLIHGAERHA